MPAVGQPAAGWQPAGCARKQPAAACSAAPQSNTLTRSPCLPYRPMLVSACKRMSLDEAPTYTVRLPAAVSQRLLAVAQYCKRRNSTCCVSALLCPAGILTRSNCASAFTANCAPPGAFFGAPRYTCATSSPAALPVFFTLKLTSSPPALASATLKFANEQVIDQNPGPIGNNGCLPC